VSAAAASAGTRRRRRRSGGGVSAVVAAGAGLGGVTVAIRSATIAVAADLSVSSVTIWKRIVRPIVAVGAARGAARVGAALPASLDLLAVAAPVQGVAILATAAATAAAIVTRDPRRRALAMLSAPLLAALALATLATRVHVPSVGPVIAGAGAAGLVAVAVLTWLVHHRPAVFPVLAVGALAFRVPVSVSGSAANLLLPLYAVIAAGTLSYAWRALRASRDDEDEPPPPKLLWRLKLAFAVVLVVYGAQSIYSTDVEPALKNVCLFYVPFALLFLLLLEVRWTPTLLRTGLGVTVVLALVFAAIGCVEFATGHLLITNAKVVEANDLLPYFRVNSLFFDPNIYGRYLALTMILLATVLLWTRRRREAVAIACALALLWAGLVFSLSQSSFAALLLGLAVLAALRWRPWPVLAGAAAAALVAVALVVFAPSVLNVETGSQRKLDRITSGRANLVVGALEMVRDRPLWGYGSGAFTEQYRERERVSSEKVAAASHTIPLTVTAEQGVIGLAAYLALVAVSLALLFRGLRVALGSSRWPGAVAVGRAGIAAAYAALLLHTLVYAAYLEDPLTWVLLAIAASLRAEPAEGSDPASAAGSDGVDRSYTGDRVRAA
jgi:putative inorganic carbon (HCO3(-)) transporter